MNTILKPDNPILRHICLPISLKELHKKETQSIIEQLLDYVYGTNNKGANRDRTKSMTVGLSANQVGILKRISVVDLAIGKKGISDIHILINPEIIWSSKAMLEKVEGCVNLDTIWGYVRRSARVKVKAFDRSGNSMLLDVKGWPAILLQHEIGHLNGELFIDKLKNPKKAYVVKDEDYRLFKKTKKNWSKFTDVSHLIKM